MHWVEEPVWSNLGKNDIQRNSSDAYLLESHTEVYNRMNFLHLFC